MCVYTDQMPETLFIMDLDSLRMIHKYLFSGLQIKREHCFEFYSFLVITFQCGLSPS